MTKLRHRFVKKFLFCLGILGVLVGWFGWEGYRESRPLAEAAMELSAQKPSAVLEFRRLSLLGGPSNLRVQFRHPQDRRAAEKQLTCDFEWPKFSITLQTSDGQVVSSYEPQQRTPFDCSETMFGMKGPGFQPFDWLYCHGTPDRVICYIYPPIERLSHFESSTLTIQAVHVPERFNGFIASWQVVKPGDPSPIPLNGLTLFVVTLVVVVFSAIVAWVWVAIGGQQ